MPPKLQALASQWIPPLTKVIDDYFASRRQAAELLSEHLVQSIDELHSFSTRGGKYLRPLLVILGYKLAGGKNVKSILPVAAGVELFHRHILNLDDIADRDEKRYGGPTLWQAYQETFEGQKDMPHLARSFAEIDGTLLGSFAFDLMNTAKIDPEITLNVMTILHRQMYFETVAGWQIHFHQNLLPLAAATEADFITGLDLVTARYTFVGPLQIGAALAGLEHDHQLFHTFHEFGRHVGTAFQMQDDILGLFGDTKETGKPVGNDVREGKKTLLLQRAFAVASPIDRKFLVKACGSTKLTAEHLDRVREIVVKTGALKSCQDLAIEEVDQGVTALQASDDLPVELVEILVELADFVVRRTK